MGCCQGSTAGAPTGADDAEFKVNIQDEEESIYQQAFPNLELSKPRAQPKVQPATGIPTTTGKLYAPVLPSPHLLAPSVDDYGNLNDSSPDRNHRRIIDNTPPKSMNAHLKSSAGDNSGLFVSDADLEMVQVIGKGTCGHVFLAKQGEDLVAVKKYNGQRPPDTLLLQMLNEVDVMRTLRHVNLAKLIGVVEHVESAPWLVVEYYSGGDLFQLLHVNREEEVPWSLRAQVASDVINGLQYLHQHNIVHCDLKSSNVILTDKRKAKLADFGLSVIRDHSTSSMSGVEVVAAGGGTTRWMAPELFSRETATLSRAADMWAYGMVLFEITSRLLPFEKCSVDEARLCLMKGDSECIPPECIEEAPDLAAVMERCWELSREKRMKADAAAGAIFAVAKRYRYKMNKNAVNA